LRARTLLRLKTLTRALEEHRQPATARNVEFGIDKAKITEVRHGAAETHHRIRLRLNAGQPDHKELLRLLTEMMTAQQVYFGKYEADVDQAIAAVEAAALYASEVLKTEWETVKLGETAYRDAVKATKYTLNGSFVVLAVLVLGYPVYYWTASYLETKPAKAQGAAAAPAAKVAVPSPAPAAAPAAKPTAPVSK
jgi:hypothetical protein